MGSPSELIWDTSCIDWEDRIKTGLSLLPDLPLFPDGDRAVSLFDMLRIPDVPGKPEMREASGDWARDIVRALFGSYDRATGVRYIREFFELVPKKNSKTTAGAAIMVTALLMNRRPNAEFLIVAPTKEVADLAYRQSVGMIEVDDELMKLFHVRDHIKQITYRTTGAFLKVKAFDTRVVTGSKPSGVLIDELHVIAQDSNADRVIGQLRGGLVSQPEAFMLTITTQSERVPHGVFKAELEKARAVRDGKMDAPLLPMLYEFPRDVEWRDPENWHMVTPNNGKSITVERLIPDYECAKVAGEGELRRWASQHLNVEVGMALVDDVWAGAEFWEGAARSLTFDDIIARSEVITVGIDGGGLDDLLGLYVIGRERDTGIWLGWGHAWAHPIALERRKENAPRMLDFSQDGDLTIVENVGDDVDQVAEIVKRIEESGLLNSVGCDPAGIGAILDRMEAKGVPHDKMQGVSQGWRLGGAIMTAERRLAEGAFTPSDQPLMKWCVCNAKIEQRANSIIITKQASGKAKIDPVIAMLNATHMMALNPAAMAQKLMMFSVG